MSWFSKKEKKEEPRVEPPVKVGDKFTYLGVEMLCTANRAMEPHMGSYPCVVAQYLDSRGILRQEIFLHGKWNAIKKEIERQGGVH